MCVSVHACLCLSLLCVCVHVRACVLRHRLSEESCWAKGEKIWQKILDPSWLFLHSIVWDYKDLVGTFIQALRRKCPRKFCVRMLMHVDFPVIHKSLWSWCSQPILQILFSKGEWHWGKLSSSFTYPELKFHLTIITASYMLLQWDGISDSFESPVFIFHHCCDLKTNKQKHPVKATYAQA